MDPNSEDVRNVNQACVILTNPGITNPVTITVTYYGCGKVFLWLSQKCLTPDEEHIMFWTRTIRCF